MRVTYDPGADMAAIHLDGPEPGVGWGESIFLDSYWGGVGGVQFAITGVSGETFCFAAEGLRGDLILGRDHSGRLLDIEVFGPREQLPDALLAPREAWRPPFLRPVSTPFAGMTYDPHSDVACFLLVEQASLQCVRRSVIIVGGAGAAERSRSAVREEILDGPAFAPDLLGDLIFDLDENGRILGIRVFSAREQLSASLLASATRRII